MKATQKTLGMAWGSNSRSSSRSSFRNSPFSDFDASEASIRCIQTLRVTATIRRTQKTLGMAWGPKSHSSSRSSFCNSPFSDFGREPCNTLGIFGFWCWSGYWVSIHSAHTSLMDLLQSYPPLQFQILQLLW
ncbi:uncharacterized protein LOC127809772 [Diospyros lotus]|uniref:uncharacterized protein LOC127809772 n=1 Tax=Diospyros lotus TaxID=55363 RepID=UPI002251F875|nr:uncharacterized protein LOC127809772 [Diospyros lotus]